MVLVKEILTISLLFGIKDFKMKHPTFLKICFCIFLKYISFFLFLMIKDGDYYFVKPGIRNSSDLFYYLWLLLSLPSITVIIFGFLVYYSFRSKNIFFFLFIILSFLAGEYFLYTYLASPLDLTNGVYNALFTILFLMIFFYKEVKINYLKKSML